MYIHQITTDLVLFLMLTFQNLFENVHITDLKETTLGANQLLDDFNKEEKFTWVTKETPLPTVAPKEDPSKFKIHLNPMEIRTFIAKISNGHRSFGIVFKPLYSVVSALLFIRLVLI